MSPRIGVLALQGDVREHVSALDLCGAKTTLVKSPSQLAEVDALVIPGGESTTISKLSRIFGLFDPLKAAISSGLPVFGTCAGLILLADRITDGISGQETFGGLDATVQRNAFGHQTSSFETALNFSGIDNPVMAAFIRAPLITDVGNGVEILSSLTDGQIVAVRQNKLLGISFHPEICGELAVHDFFIREMI